VAFANLCFDRTLLAVFFPLAMHGVYNARITPFKVLVGIALVMAGVLFPAYSAKQNGPQSPRPASLTLYKSSHRSSRPRTRSDCEACVGVLCGRSLGGRC
jgi:hypothetical protein